MGDFNINYLDRNDHKDEKHFINLLGFDLMISKPTRITETSSTLIDLAITTDKNKISSEIVIPLSLSDHDMIGIVRKRNYQRYEPKTIKCRNFTRYNPDLMNEDLRQADWNLVYDQNDPNKAWEIFKGITSNIFNRHAPLITKRIKGRPCPWLTSNVRAELNDRDAALRRWRRTKDEGDWNIYRRKKNRCTNRIRQARNNYHKELLSENQNNSKKFWSRQKTATEIKRQIKSRRKVTRQWYFGNKCQRQSQYVLQLFC